MAIDQQAFQDYLKNPLLFPQEFKAWMGDWFATNVPKIHVSQIFGFKLYSVKSADPFAGTLSTTSSSFVDLSGPSLAGLSNGFFVMAFGFKYGWSTSATTKDDGSYLAGQLNEMGLSIDGGSVDTNKIASVNMGNGGRIALFDLTQGDDNHTIGTRYKANLSGTQTSARFVQPWLHAIRVSTNA